MNEHPGIAAVAPPDLHKFVGQSPAQVGITDHLLQLFVQKNRLPCPINLSVDVRKKKAKKSGR